MAAGDKTTGQVATPERIAILMAKWVMSGKPRTLLDPAAGLGGLLARAANSTGACNWWALSGTPRRCSERKTTAPRGTKLVLADYLKSDSGQFDGIIANPPYEGASARLLEKNCVLLEERFGTPLDRLTNLYALFC